MSLRVLLLMAVASVQAGITVYGEDPIREPQPPGVRVWVINAARVDEWTLSTALDQAAWIFRSAGVRLTWLECPRGGIQTVEPAMCFVDDPGVLVVRIMRQPANNWVAGDALGYAIVDGRSSTYATVFRNRVLAVTNQFRRCSEARLLGHAIAHELGHLLLGTSSHASYGLMAGHWGETALYRASLGVLQFSPAEGACMRAEALRRANQDAQAPASSWREVN